MAISTRGGTLDERIRKDFVRTESNPYNFPHYVKRATVSGTPHKVKELKGKPKALPPLNKARRPNSHLVTLKVKALTEQTYLTYNYESLSKFLGIPKSTLQFKLSKKPYDEYFEVTIKEVVYNIKKIK